MAVRYLGSETMTYMDYVDLSTGTTLVAEPGCSYDIMPSGGHAAEMPAMPSDGRFTVVETPAGDAGNKKNRQPDEG